MLSQLTVGQTIIIPSLILIIFIFIICGCINLYDYCMLKDSYNPETGGGLEGQHPDGEGIKQNQRLMEVT